MNRLQTIANLVDANAVLYDIGTDHAYLLLEVYNKISQGFACDIADKPLQTAINTININNLSNKIQPVLSNGLDKVNFDLATNISICGMGSELIIDILSASSAKFGDFNHFKGINFILQPMTRTELLRKFLLENGFEITTEVVSIEERRVYTVILCKYTENKQNVDIFDCYTSSALSKDSKFSQYLDYNINHYQSICNQISDHQNERFIKYSTIIKKLNSLF